MENLDLPKRPILLDGGMGRELRTRGLDLPSSIWSASALIQAPEIVRQIHLDYISAGADIITTNTYGIIRKNSAGSLAAPKTDAILSSYVLTSNSSTKPVP